MPLNRKISSIATIILAGFAIHLSSLFNTFHFDDRYAIILNEHIKNPHNILRFFYAPYMSSAFSGGAYRPILTLSYSLNYLIFGLNPHAFIFFNLLIHITNAILVFFIARILFVKITKEIAPEVSAFTLPLIVSLLFLSSPVNSEVVNYVVARSTGLSSLFFLLSFLIFLQLLYKETVKNKPLQRAFVFISFLLAWGTKQTTITLPLIFLLFIFIFRTKKIKSLSFIYFSALSLIIFLGFLSIRIPIYGSISGLNRFIRTPYINLITQFKVIIKYILLFIFPVGLNVEHEVTIANSFFGPTVMASFLIIITILAAALCLYKRNKLITFFILWFFINLAPTSTVIPRGVVMSEQRVYLSGVACFILLGYLIFRVSNKLSERIKTDTRTILWILSILIMFIWSLITIQRSFIWRTELSLWQDAAKKSPGLARVQNNLGMAYLEKNELNKAQAHFLKAIQIDPRNNNAIYNLGVVYLKGGKHNEALNYFLESEEIMPDSYHTKEKLGSTFILLGEYDKALGKFEEALKLNPNNPVVWNNFAVYNSQVGNFKDAAENLKQAIRLKPDYIEARMNLANIYIIDKKYKEARQEYETILTLDPGNILAKNRLAAIADN